MLEIALFSAIAAALGVAALKHVTGVQLWHVFFLSLVSLCLIMFPFGALVDPENQAIAEWVPFGGYFFYAWGLFVGIISLVRSYQYRGALSKKLEQQHREQLEATRGRERRSWNDVLK